MKKSMVSLLVLCGLSLFVLAGCNQNEPKPDLKDGDEISFTEVRGDVAPDNVVTVAEKSEGKTEFCVIRDEHDFYVVLSAAADATPYEIEKIVVQATGNAKLLAVNMRNAENTDDGSTVCIYKVEKMTYEDGFIFQMANNPAVDEENDSDQDDGGTAMDGRIVAVGIKEPSNNQEISGGSLGFKGDVNGTVSQVNAVLTIDDGGTVIGEAEALVADLSKEYSGKLNYQFPDDFEREDDVYVPCTLKVYCVNESGVELTEKSVSIQVK